MSGKDLKLEVVPLDVIIRAWILSCDKKFHRNNGLPVIIITKPPISGWRNNSNLLIMLVVPDTLKKIFGFICKCGEHVKDQAVRLTSERNLWQQVYWRE